MTVHFKGISRHQSKHKARRVKGASPQRTMRLAGLRSDQLGICREPADMANHVLRKKAGLASGHQRYGHQSSEYQRQFQWKTPAAESPLLSAQEMLYSSNRSIPPYKSYPIAMESEYKRSFKASPPPRGPRLRKDMELNENPSLKMENNSSEKILKKKMKRQYQGLDRKSSPKDKTPHLEPQPLEQKMAVSPKLVRKVKTEYNSNFRSPLQYRYREGAWVRSRNVGEEGHEWYHEVQELREKAKAYRKRTWGSHFSRQHLSQILSEQNCLWEVSSGYSPSTLNDEDTHSTSSPTIEALDLASIRESYSSSASVSLTTSRRSSCNKADLPSNLTLPEARRNAWDEEVSPCERGVAKTKQQKKEQPEENKEENINGHSQDNQEKDIVAERDQLLHVEKSESSSDEGRLPTPKHKTKMAAQRNYHDRTTLASGGALLVSPSKSKHTKNFGSSEPLLGKANSPFRHLSCVSGRICKTEGVNLSGTSLAAGMATVDPIPLREDTWDKDSPGSLPDPKPTRKTSDKTSSSARLMDTSPSHANRIQGSLRNPEFQHNGILGVHQPERFVFPSHDCMSDDDLDDRMSQISFHSAASCSVASQVLDRAQKRKTDFWGKS